MGFFRSGAVLLCLIGVLNLVEISLQAGSDAPNDTAPIDVAWPTSRNATCVSLASLVNASRVPIPCLPYITYDSIYVDYNQEQRETFGRLITSASWANPDCRIASFRIGCFYMFRPCVEVPIPGVNGTASNETVAVARYFCRDGCKSVYNVCSAAIYYSLASQGDEGIFEEVTSCDPPWSVLYGVNLAGVQTFPNTTQYTVPVSADNYTTVFETNLTCYYDNWNVTSEPTSDICPSGMYYNIDDGTCALECPEPLLTRSEFNAVAGVSGAFGWISFILTITLLLSFLLEKRRRTFPHDLFIYFVVSLLLLSFSFVIASVVGFRDIDCDDWTTPNTWGSVGCTVQGMLYVYFSLASVYWWFIISLNYFLIIVMRYDTKPVMEWRDWLSKCFDGSLSWRPWVRWETLYVVYHLCAWGLPLIPLIISMAAHKLGYGGHDIWCTIHSDSQVHWVREASGQQKHTGGDDANVWHLILLDVPIFVAICIGCGLLVTIIAVGIKNHKGRVWEWSFIKNYWRIILFLGFYFYIYVFVFSFHIHQGVEREDQYDKWDEYIDCSFKQTVYLSLDYVIDCPVDRVINFPLWVIMALNVASQGTIAFLILGTSRVLLHQWWWFITKPLVLAGYMPSFPLDYEEYRDKNGAGPAGLRGGGGGGGVEELGDKDDTAGGGSGGGGGGGHTPRTRSTSQRNNGSDTDDTEMTEYHTDTES